jgi:hypothetical protein
VRDSPNPSSLPSLTLAGEDPESFPKALPRSAVEALVETVTQDRESERQTDWTESDLALILTELLGGLRACQADVGCRRGSTVL